MRVVITSLLHLEVLISCLCTFSDEEIYIYNLVLLLFSLLEINALFLLFQNIRWWALNRHFRSHTH